MKIKPPRQAQEWSYSSHRESIGKALSPPGIRSNKKTYIDCGSSARMTAINGAYLINLPRKFVRSMAGFPTYGRFFHIARAALDPPTSFCKKLFPAIGE
ncbi:hypothetical protein [Absidia glauca]|uniref:Ndc10 domain-containing protein n=1 Tax=Absidia glauca TaxID=4829 RepID=A0A163K5U8_ABSGL|nr:hypothetical protein [Absidia glauca]